VNGSNSEWEKQRVPAREERAQALANEADQAWAFEAEREWGNEEERQANGEQARGKEAAAGWATAGEPSFAEAQRCECEQKTAEECGVRPEWEFAMEQAHDSKPDRRSGRA
jgi:hypothetical protein